MISSKNQETNKDYLIELVNLLVLLFFGYLGCLFLFRWWRDDSATNSSPPTTTDTLHQQATFSDSGQKQDDTKDGIRPSRPTLQNLPQTKHSSTSVPRPTFGPVESLGIENADATTVAAVVPRVESEHTKSHCQHQPLTKRSNPSSTSNYYHGHQTVSIGCSDAHSTEVAASPRLDSVNVVCRRKFHNSGELLIVTRADILNYQCDAVGNSVDAKESQDDDVLCRGNLATKFSKACGRRLKQDLLKRKPWTYGELIVSHAYNLYAGKNSPLHVFHFCVPNRYEGASTYQRLRSLFERALNICHDMGIGSIAFPLIRAGLLGYPQMDVMKALVDACSLFREKDSKLKTVSIVVWKDDLHCQKILEATCKEELENYGPIGMGYYETIPDASDYSNPETAFRNSMGKDRVIKKLKVLPVRKGDRYLKYLKALKKVRDLRPDMATVEKYGWHGTHGDYANQIDKNGFDLSRAGSSYGTLYGKGAYFASKADIAHRFVIPGGYIPAGEKESLGSSQIENKKLVHTMLLCKLITGKQQLGTPSMTRPDPGYDSTINGNNTYYVLFDPDCILPIAIIEYTIQ